MATATETVTDRQNKPASSGDRAYVLPSRQGERDGGFGYIRAFSRGKARIDDGAPAERGDNYTWSAWCKPEEFELVPA